LGLPVGRIGTCLQKEKPREHSQSRRGNVKSDGKPLEKRKDCEKEDQETTGFSARLFSDEAKKRGKEKWGVALISRSELGPEGEISEKEPMDSRKKSNSPG